MQQNQIQALKTSELCGRQFTVYGTVEEPLFKAKDVASIIEYNNITNLLGLVDDDEKGVRDYLTPGGNQQVWFLTEDGLYEVLMQSRKPIAKEFKKGVKEILKTIRKTGGYISTKQDDTPEEIMARALLVAQDTIKRKDERLKQLEAQTEQQQATIELQTEEMKKAAPKVEYYEKVLSSQGYLTVNMIASCLGISDIKLNKLLCQWGVQYKESGTYYLYAKYRDKGLTVHKPHAYTDSNGNIRTRQHMYWKEEGKKFVIDLYHSKMAS